MRRATQSVTGCPSWAGLLAIAAAAFFIVAGGIGLYGGWGYIDPWIYTGLIHEYGDTLARFGRTYYSTRVAAIWPQGLLYSLIGEPAYLLIRWLTLFGAGAGLALALRGLGSRWVGYFAGVALVFFSPLLFELTDDYTQDVAICYAMLAFAAVVRQQPVFAVVAGILSSAALGAHEISIYLLAPALVGLAAAALPQLGIKGVARQAALFFAGAIGVQVVLSVTMGALYGWTRPNVLFQETAVRFAVSLGQGFAANWSVPWDNTFGRITTAVIITLVWLALTTIAVSRRDRVIPPRLLGATVAMGVLMAMVLVTHFVFQASYVGTPYTIVTAAVLTLSCAWLALSALTDNGKGATTAGVALALAVATGFLAADTAGRVGIREQIWWGSVAVTLALAVAAFNPWARLAHKHFRSLLAVGACILAGITVPLAPLTTDGSAHALYNSIRSIGVAETVEKGPDLRKVTVEVQQIVVERVPPDVPLRFWYPSGAGMEHFTSIQSTFLWMGTCILCDQNPNPFPDIPRESATALLDAGIQVLIVLAPSRSLAVQASSIAGTPPLPFTQRDTPVRVSSGSLTVWVAISARPGAIPPE